MSDALAEMMLRNLREVFSERDPARRKAAIAAIYAEDAVLYEAEGQVEGREAIDAHVGGLLNRFPAAFAFTPRGAPARNHDIGRLCWQLGPAGAAAVRTGMDVARFEGGRIRALYVFLDPNGH